MIQRVLAQFATSAGKRLLSLQQDGSVVDYCRDFISIATHAPTLQEETLELAFIMGLEPLIRSHVKTFKPHNLQRMKFYAAKVEDWAASSEKTMENHAVVNNQGKRLDPPRYSGPANQSGPRNGSGPSHIQPNIAQVPSSRPTTTFHNSKETQNPSSHNHLVAPLRRLTPEEIAQRKANNL